MHGFLLLVDFSSINTYGNRKKHKQNPTHEVFEGAAPAAGIFTQIYGSKHFQTAFDELIIA